MVDIEYEGELRRLFKPKVREKLYWEFLRLVAPSTSTPPGKLRWKSEDAIAMYCMRCKEFLQFSKGNSNSVRRHMQNVHGQFLDEGKKKEHEEMERKRKSGIVSYFANDSCRVAKKMKESTAGDATEFNRIVATWICRSLRPLAIVEDDGLRKAFEFANTCSGKLPLHKRQTVTENVEAIASDLRRKLGRIISTEMVYYSSTTDIWTSCATESFISFASCH